MSRVVQHLPFPPLLRKDRQEEICDSGGLVHVVNDARLQF